MGLLMIKKVGSSVLVFLVVFGVVLNNDSVRTYLTIQYKRLISDSSFELECLSVDLPKYWVINEIGEPGIHLERLMSEGEPSFYLGIFPMKSYSFSNNRNISKVDGMAISNIQLYELKLGNDEMKTKNILPLKNLHVVLIGDDFQSNQIYIKELLLKMNKSEECN